MYAVVEELERRAAEAAKSNDHATALDILKEALSAYRSLPLTDTMREHYLLTRVGCSAQECGQLEIARRYHEEALRLLRHASEPEYRQLATTLHDLGDTHLQRAEPQIAQIYLSESASWFHRICDYETAAHVVFDLAELVKDRGEWVEAQSCYRECLKLTRLFNGSSAHKILVLCSLAELVVDYAGVEPASSYFTNALSIAEDGNLTPEGFMAWDQLGLTAERLKDDDTAVRCGETALRLARTAEKPEDIARVLFNLGRYEAQRGNGDIALRYLEESSKTFCSLNEVESAAHVASALGHLAHGRCDYDRALGCFKESLRQLYGLRRRDYAIRQIYHIAVLFYLADRYPAACRYFGAVERLCEEVSGSQALSSDERQYIADIRKWAVEGRGRLPHARYWNEGRALSYSAAVEQALAESWERKSGFRWPLLFGRRGAQEKTASNTACPAPTPGSEESERSR
jgi:tetratricopeptide (TPR) repeat protein